MIGRLKCIFNNFGREHSSQNCDQGSREIPQGQLQGSRNGDFSKKETLWSDHGAIPSQLLCVGYWRPFALDKGVST